MREKEKRREKKRVEKRREEKRREQKREGKDVYELCIVQLVMTVLSLSERKKTNQIEPK